MYSSVCYVLLDSLQQVLSIGKRLFDVQTIREIKIENKKLGGKKKVSSVFTQYVCLFVCLFVCHRSTDFIV